MRRTIALVLAGMLGGCATTYPMDWDRPPPPDWPKLAENIVDVPVGDIRALCVSKGVGSHDACTTFIFEKRVCNIYTSTREAAAMKHERGHCRGYDHPGDSKVRNAWATYKARGGK